MTAFALPPAPDATLLAAFAARATASADAPALHSLDGESLSWSAWAEAAWYLGGALVEQGVMPGDRVAILASNRPLWPIADLGILLIGGISVGLYPTSAPAQIAEVLADSGARVLIVDSQAQASKLDGLRTTLPALERVIVAEPASTDDPRDQWSAFLEAGAVAAAKSATAQTMRDRLQRVTPADTAVLIYTSGSTGRPKGARISHRTLLASAESVASALRLTASDSSLSFLPFCHAGERIFGQATRILTGMPALLLDDASAVWEGARSFHPTLFGGMPRFFEKAADALHSAARESEGPTRRQWERAEALGRERSRLRRAGAEIPPALETEWRSAVTVAAPLLERFFGTRLRLATSGGAPLLVAAAERLDAFGVTVLGAYGQTEHLCAAMHRPSRYDFTTAGPPMPGTELRTAEDGEILIRRSALTFDGYFARPAESAEAFSADGEWLFTGDLGMIEADGRLRVTGRKKELIALSTGKKVAPLPIEAALAADPWIAQAMCVGEGRKFLAAVIALRESSVLAWSLASGRDPADVVEDSEVVAAVASAVERVNAELSRSEQLKRWVLLPREFSLETGELTPTLKIRRAEVARLHAAAIDSLYD